MQAPHIHIDDILEKPPANRPSVGFGCMPLIIDGLVSDWDASTTWTREHLSSTYGAAEVTCFVASQGRRSFLQQVNRPLTMPFADLLAHVYSETNDYLLYLRIDTDHELFESLSQDFEIPPLLDCYNPSATGIWIGEKGNLTPFHHDWWHSFLAQISGRKRYTLVHPFEGEELQRDWDIAAAYDLKPAPYAPPGHPEPDRFETSFQGILEPGQMLYIPPYWFHQIETLDNGNISMPIRFDTVQSPNVPIYQFSQGTLLRQITNKPTSKTDRLLDVLAANRERFHSRERAFIEAFVETRSPNKSSQEIVDELNAAAEGLGESDLDEARNSTHQH